ncbi:MAG: hypothetical protein ACOC5T_02630 [Elusimicrobiota bacterium]
MDKIEELENRIKNIKRQMNTITEQTNTFHSFDDIFQVLLWAYGDVFLLLQTVGYLERPRLEKDIKKAHTLWINIIIDDLIEDNFKDVGVSNIISIPFKEQMLEAKKLFEQEKYKKYANQLISIAGLLEGYISRLCGAE